MDTWVARPAKPPYRCHRTLADSEADGPYFESAFAFFEGVLDPNRVEVLPAPGPPRTLYISARHLREICSAPGSPFVLLDKDEHARQVAESEALRAERDDLAQQVDELEADVRRLREQNPTSLAAIAEALRAEMDERYARRPGPRKKTAA